MPDHPYAPAQLARLGDADLVRLARELADRGDAERETAKRAVAAVLLRHSSLVRAVIAARVPREEVDELEAQVRLRFVQRVGAAAEVENPAGLLVGIAKNVRADFHERRHDPDAPLEDWDAAVGDPALEDELVRQAVEELLAPLGERERRVVWQRKIEGRSSAEVAAIEDTTPGNIDVIVFRALRKMREAAS